MEIKINTEHDNLDEVLDYLHGPYMMAAIESFRHYLRTLEKHQNMTEESHAVLQQVQDYFAQEFAEFLR